VDRRHLTVWFVDCSGSVSCSVVRSSEVSTLGGGSRFLLVGDLRTKISSPDRKYKRRCDRRSNSLPERNGTKVDGKLVDYWGVSSSKNRMR
jgi:hypothetical protein